MMEYPKKPNGSINFSKLSKMTGINASTLSTRYRRGLRGKDLITSERYVNRGGKKLELNGKEIEITAKQEEKMKQFRLHKNTIQQRLDEGWDFEDAIGYPPDYIKFDDLICLKVMRGKDEILIPSDTVDDLIEMNVKITGLKRTLTSNNKPIKKVFPPNMLVFKNRQILGERFTSRLIREEKERKAEARKEEEQRQRAKKPHLYNGTPQKHSRSNYCQYLMNTSIFPKKAVR